MLQVSLICVGKLKEKYWEAAVREYLTRLKRYLKINILEIDEAVCADEKSPACIHQAKKNEGNRILQKIKGLDLLIALDKTGRQFTSEEWADWLNRQMVAGKSQVGMMIGGSYGLAQEVLQRADLIWSFSPLTFAHQMMRAMVLEQLYRAMKIIKNENYHK